MAPHPTTKVITLWQNELFVNFIFNVKIQIQCCRIFHLWIFFLQKLEFCHNVLAITLTNTEKLAFWIKSNQKSLKGSYSIYVQKLPLPKVPPKRKRIYRIIGYRFSLMFIIGRAFFGQGPFLKNKQKIIFAIFCNWNIFRSTLRSTQWLFVVDGWQSFVWLN